jgi:Tfp pilus assembly protein PilF
MKKKSPTEVETAREYFKTAVKYKKHYARAYLGLAKVYVERGEIVRAKELAKIALKYGLIAPMDQQALFILNLN